MACLLKICSGVRRAQTSTKLCLDLISTLWLAIQVYSRVHPRCLLRMLLMVAQYLLIEFKNKDKLSFKVFWYRSVREGYIYDLSPSSNCLRITTLGSLLYPGCCILFKSGRKTETYNDFLLFLNSGGFE